MNYEFFTLMMIVCFFISIFASTSLKSTYKKYMKIQNSSHFSGAQVAASILRQFGINDVRVEETSGELSDHYDPRYKVVRLSTENYHGTSIAAVSVAAHECGHAIQHAKHYAPLNIRNTIVPVVNLGSKLSWPMILIGLLLGITGFLDLGIILFSFSLIFQLITLPVEFNASSRALRILDESGMLYDDELRGAKKVLSAAAMTYVAAAIATLLSLLRLIILFGGRRRND